jgi:HPr kinase/phosphorylase
MATKSTRKFTVLDLLGLDLKEHNDLHLTCIGGRSGLNRPIKVPDINRPGLALNGFYENFAFQRVQLFGRGETAYLRKLAEEGKTETLRELFKQDVPCVMFSHSLTPTDDVYHFAEESGCPILQTSLPSSEFSSRLIRALSNIFAQREIVHGVLAEVFGIGVLLRGDSGVGKSETALELVERGHRLVADDTVQLHCASGNFVNGEAANRALGHHMEIRGLGIINITHLFGVGAIRDTKQVQLVVDLEEWDPEKEYDRFGADERTVELLGVHVPALLIPVKPGRNIPIIIETAAMNERLKKMGYFSAKEFNESVIKWLESENARNIYLRRRQAFRQEASYEDDE